jgi:hypothetical protein
MQLEVRTGGHPERSGEERATQSKDPGLIRRLSAYWQIEDRTFELARDPSTSALRASAQDDDPLYSHSIVAGGFELMSKQTRLMPFTSFMIRLLIRASNS